jgi:protein-S-isoprenylcysteine O-methyltransferase Ste14
VNSAGPPDTLTAAVRRNDRHAFRLVMSFFAVVTVLAGVVVAFVPLGIEDLVARSVSSALLLAGICDTLVLRFWHRLFPT